MSSQLKKANGDEIFYPVNDDRDRQWARRLEWVVKQHLDRAEDDLDELHADYIDVMRQSKEAHERKYDQRHIVDLYKQLDTANRALRDLRR